jgi:hypothetical protein
MGSLLEKPQNISLESSFILLKQGWKIIVIGVILGGLFGLAVSSKLSAEYETKSVFSFSIDYARTGLLTDIEEDQAMEIAGDLINSTQVFQATQTRADAMGLKITSEEFRSRLTAERRFDQWLLKVRWNNPETAARLANLWSETTLEAMQSAQQAAWKADSLHRYILSLESCFQQSTSGLPAQPLCQASNRSELQTEMQKSGVDLQRWQNDSKGIFPGLNYTWAQEASVPDAPIQHSQGSLIFAGCLIGLMASAIISLFVLKI